MRWVGYGNVFRRLNRPFANLQTVANGAVGRVFLYVYIYPVKLSSFLYVLLILQVCYTNTAKGT